MSSEHNIIVAKSAQLSLIGDRKINQDRCVQVALECPGHQPFDPVADPLPDPLLADRTLPHLLEHPVHAPREIRHRVGERAIEIQ